MRSTAHAVVVTARPTVGAAENFYSAKDTQANLLCLLMLTCFIPGLQVCESEDLKNCASPILLCRLWFSVACQCSHHSDSQDFIVEAVRSMIPDSVSIVSSRWVGSWFT